MILLIKYMIPTSILQCEMDFTMQKYIILMIRANFTLNKLAGPLIYALYDNNLTIFPYFVANPISCRNNSDKNLAIFLESAQNPRTFASVI